MAKVTVRVTRSRRKRCDVDWCTVHNGNRKLGPHAIGRRVWRPGHLDAVVMRWLLPDGRRVANMAVYDLQAQTWTYQVPLPARPRKALVEAVAEARVFVRTGEVR